MELITRFNKSTRFGLLVVLILFVVTCYVYGQISTPDIKDDWLSADQMLDFIKWAFGIYATSEIGAKATVSKNEN